MDDRDQTLYAAAARYEALLRAGRVVGIREFVREYAVELRDELAEYLELGVALSEPPLAETLTTAEQASVDRVAARMRERLQTSLPVPVVTLTEMRRVRTLSPAGLARQINLPVALLARIERGGVDPTTIPERLIVRMAAALERAADEVRRALSAPPLAAAGVRLSAVQGMQVPTEQVVSFTEALAVSGATPEQQHEWGS